MSSTCPHPNPQRGPIPTLLASRHQATPQVTTRPSRRKAAKAYLVASQVHAPRLQASTPQAQRSASLPPSTPPQAPEGGAWDMVIAGSSSFRKVVGRIARDNGPCLSSVGRPPTSQRTGPCCFGQCVTTKNKSCSRDGNSVHIAQPHSEPLEFQLDT